MTKDELHENIFAALSIVAEEYGFLSQNQKLILKFDEFLMKLTYGIGRVSEEEMTFEGGTLTIWVKFTQIEEFWEEFSSLLNINDDSIVTFWNSRAIANVDAGVSKIYPLNKEGVSELVSEMNSSLSNLFSDTKKCLSLTFLDEYLNSNLIFNQNQASRFQINDQGLIFRRMIVAYLNRNELFDQICDSERKNFPLYQETAKTKGLEYFSAYPEIFEKVYSKLVRSV